MKIILEGNVQVSMDNSQTVSNNSNLRVNKDSKFYLNRYAYGNPKPISGNKYSRSTLALGYSSELFMPPTNNYDEVDKEKISKSAYDDYTKKIILDNFGALKNSPYFRGGNKMLQRRNIELIRNYAKINIDSLDCTMDTSYINNTIKMVKEVNGTKFFGTTPKNIIFGIKDARVVYQRYISEGVWFDNDDDDGGYTADLYCIENNIINKKDGSMVSRYVGVCKDYDWLEHRETLYNLPDSLKEFIIPFFLCDALTDEMLTNYTKVNYDYNDYKDTINEYRIYEKEKAIAYNDGYRHSVFAMLFNNVTEELEWKKNLAKIYKKDNHYLQNGIPEKYNIEDILHFRTIVTIVKDGTRFIMNRYSACDNSGCTYIYNPYLSGNDRAVVHAFSANLEPLIPHCISKLSREVYDVKTKMMITEDSKFVILRKDGEIVATYEKILINEEIKYVLQSIEDNEYSYYISSPSKSAPAPFQSGFGRQQIQASVNTYRDMVIVFRCKKKGCFRLSSVSDTTKSDMLPLSKFTFDKPNEDVSLNFKDIEFREIRSRWDVPSPEYIPHDIHDDREYVNMNKDKVDLLWQDERHSYTYILQDRPQKLVDSFMDSKQQSIIDMGSLVDKHYGNVGPKVSLLYKPGEVYPFNIRAVHKYTFGEFTLKIEVLNTFIYYPNKMDVEALQYHNSETISVKYECDIDTTKTLDFSRYTDGIINIPYVTIDIVNNLVNSLKEYEDLVNNYLNKLSKNTTEQEEETLFEEDEINKLLFIMSSFNDVLFK